MRIQLPEITTTRALQAFQVMRQGAVIATSILLAKSSLAVADIGAYEALLYIGTVLTFFWVNGLLQGMPVTYNKQDEDGQKVFIYNNFLIFNVFALLLFLLLYFGGALVAPLLTGFSDIPHAGWFFLYMLFNLPTFPVEYYYLLLKKPTHILLWGMASFGLHVVAVILPLWLGYSMRESLACLALLAVLKWLWSFLLVWQAGIWRIDREQIRHYLTFCIPLVLNVLVGNLVVMFDNWLVGWWYQDKAVFAIFRYGARELPLAQALATALGVALVPRLMEDMKGGLADMKAMTRKLYHVLFPATILLMFISKPLFPLVFNPQFADSAGLFNIYLLITASRVLLPASIVLAHSDPGIIFKVGLLELAAKAVLGITFIYLWGLPGVAASAVLAYWVEKIGLMWYVHRRYGHTFQEWIDFRWYAIYTIAMLAALWLS